MNASTKVWVIRCLCGQEYPAPLNQIITCSCGVILERTGNKTCAAEVPSGVDVSRFMHAAPGIYQTSVAVEIPPKYGFSLKHDAILDYCIAHRIICPTGCVKDGAPNCYAHAMGIQGIEQCEPGRLFS